ncbi:hypothetical protein DH2020_023200 [Rehmannia glutinosa]|uniref:SKP1-like protein n=1 Tax=Rehmannia glutinosa TaxID=99300 RepID=A0ABR0W675_REHGL
MSSAVKMIVLKSSDGETFEVEDAVAAQSQSIKHLIEDDCADTVIPVHNVTSKILAKVLEYCKRHVDAAKSTDDLKAFDAEFVKVDQGTLFGLILAANYLDIKSLFDLICDTVANMMKGKTPEEIRKTFHIKNDYTPKVEEEVRKENSWAFQVSLVLDSSRYWGMEENRSVLMEDPTDEEKAILDLDDTVGEISIENSSWTNYLVGKLITDKSWKSFYLIGIMKKAWKAKAEITAREWGGGLILFRFSQWDDMDWVLQKLTMALRRRIICNKGPEGE